MLKYSISVIIIISSSSGDIIIEVRSGAESARPTQGSADNAAYHAIF